MFRNRTKFKTRPLLAMLGKWIALATLATALSACNSDDGGIIGTGIMLDGTTSSTRAYASNDIEIKAMSGERSMATIAATGRFSVADLMGTGPYMLRADLGNSDYLYGIAYEDDSKRVTRNVHSYTDAALRNWFATQGLDIDDTFAGIQPVAHLPTEPEIDAILDSLFAIVAAVLGDYKLDGTNLATASYDANDTGVDLYLDNNPVLVNNGSITIIVTQQGTLTSTQASTNIPLTTDLTATDNEAPSVPGSVRALASASNEIVVVWESSTDNIGVTEYQVFRDAVLIATTPYPVYTDTNLSSDVDYGYHVVAIDASGNASPSSIPATSQTLAAADSIAPPAPQSVVLTPAIANMRISWNQTEIGDVAAFNISRSVGSGVSTTLANVTANFLTDFNVMSGTQYCYQVTAVDASGNESPSTPVECVSTLGAIVSTPDGTVGPGTGELTAPMVDVSALICTDILDRDIDQDTSLAKGCYLANDGITVSEPANLTLQPGVVIKLGAGADILVNTGASLTAEGTVADPIILSGREATPGFWEGINFLFSNSINNRLDHVQVEYAGGGSNGAAILLDANSLNPARVSISNSSILNSSSYGFSFDAGSLIDKFDRNRVTGNASTGRIEPTTATSIANTGDYTGNANDALVLTTDSIDKATTFNDIDIPYLADNIGLDAKLDIKPGVIIEFKAGAVLRVNSAGTINAIGTATDPILLTSVEPSPGFWDGVNVFFSNTGNTMQHVIIEYGGGTSTDSGNLVLQANSSNPSRLSASNLILRNSQTNGFYIDSGANLSQFDNITSTLNQRAGYVDAPMMGSLGTGSNFIGNTEDLIRVGSGGIGSDFTVLDHGVPYSMIGLILQNKLDIGPGVTMIMDAGSAIRINNGGALSANGTATQPIVFTAQEPTPGYWEGIYFFFSPTVNNKLDHVVVEYGGGGTGNNSTTGNIALACNSSNPARVQLSNVSSNFSLGWGLFIDDNGCDVTIGVNVNYAGNAEGELNLAP
ncbi:MAG: hypothetical protein V3U65_07475 [Granulosicoccaceae bacterium]